MKQALAKSVVPLHWCRQLPRVCSNKTVESIGSHSDQESFFLKPMLMFTLLFAR